MRAVNLIPSDQRAGAGSVTGDSEGGAFLVIGLLAGIAVLALMYGIASHQASTRKSEVASVTAEAQAAQSRASELAPYVSFKALYQARLQAVSMLAGTRFDWAHAFHEIGRVLPADTSLSSIHGTIGPATETGSATGTAGSSARPPVSGTVASATPPGTVPTFSLAGCATSQSEVAEVLQRMRLINGVSAVTLQSSTKATTGGGSGSCPTGDPAFAAEVTFSPLPTPAAVPGASTTTAAATSPSTTSPSTTPSAGGAQ